MTIEEIIEYVTGLGGVLAMQPTEGSEAPEIAWGDTFFYYAPDGVVPAGQPFATIVTKDYPGDETSDLNRPGSFRVNIAVSKTTFTDAAAPTDASLEDAVVAHPLYAAANWLAVVNPGAATDASIREMLREAHDRARARSERRAAE
ncbi:DUF6194 family protein [Nocardia salmonicida]|uniref:DUF6194 family protein n=1 Tax=Nocardia salmonicida TaxID=53431 RepID=UPI0007A39341|nr:DUF6194 family protein [Nocardia salmonicida]